MPLGMNIGKHMINFKKVLFYIAISRRQIPKYTQHVQCIHYIKYIKNTLNTFIKNVTDDLIWQYNADKCQNIFNGKSCDVFI